jgi:amino acid transporter
LVKLLYFLVTIFIMLGINMVAAYFFQMNVIDLALPVGILGILVTAPNNPLTDFFNSKPFMEPEEARYAKLGKVPIYASIAYTLYSIIFIFIYYKSYFV